MTKVLVLGANGMLGNYVSTYFLRSGKYDVTALNRTTFDAVLNNVADLHINQYDVVINCIGVIKPLVHNVGVLNTTLVNSIFPHILANECQKHNVKMIHITTDCVFSGKTGFYVETSEHDALDVYGKTKSLGEPDNSMVIRTSIIGEEVNSNRSLIEWVKSNNGKTVDGYTNHTWNGLTCLEVAKFIERCIINNIYWEGVRHIFNTTPTTKLELVELIALNFNIDLTVVPKETTTPVYRTLSTVHLPLINTSISKQLRELSGFWNVE
jgi:dTDP-4-dehydrorhamnose reductase